jgi:hypothetical protein
MVGRPTARVRVRQFLRAVAARTRPPDDTAARELLAPPLYGLFERMSPEDRRHGLEMLRLVRAAGESEAVVLQAALLHDVGKAEAGIGLAHRILRVLLADRLPRVWGWLSGWPTGWQRPFWALANHPARGACWVESVGGDPLLGDLIRYHESLPPESWRASRQEERLLALARADARC